MHLGAKYMAVMNGKGLPAKDNLNVDAHPFWSQVSLIDVASDGTQFNDIVWLDPAIWDMDQPEFSCEPPCRVKVPFYTGATSTVDFPLMTVSQDGWTSTITVPPLTLSKLGFDVVTLVDGPVGNRLNRRAFEEFWPVPATTTAWPLVVYTGPDGQQSTTTPNVAFPTPPPSIGPGAPPPAKGTWPKAALRPRVAAIDPNQQLDDSAQNAMCKFWADRPDYFDELIANCPNWRSYRGGDPVGQMPITNFSWWNLPLITPGGTSIGPGGDSNDLDEAPSCELPEQSTTTTTSTTQQPTATATPKVERPDAKKNEIKCFHQRQMMDNEPLRNGARSFCNYVAQQAGVRQSSRRDLAGRATIEIKDGFKANWKAQLDGSKHIDFNLEVHGGENCVWTYNFDECLRYMLTPVDSCNCAGVNGKQGGYGKNNCMSWMTGPEDG